MARADERGSFRGARGRTVISRATADEVGEVSHLLVDAAGGYVTAVVIGKGRKARLVSWEQVSGFGPDAVVVDGEDAIRPPDGEREEAAAQGKLDLVGKRALGEDGNEFGTVDDLRFDTDTGRLESVVVAGRDIPASALLGGGSYAVILAGSGVVVP